MGSTCFKDENIKKRQKQIVVVDRASSNSSCKGGIQQEKEKRKQISEKRITQKKPVILFYGFEGPFQCELLTKTPQLVTCFPKPNCEKSIKWSGVIKDNKLIIRNHTYPYLFWESASLQQSGLKPHFRISREDMSQTVFELLISLGLSEEESTNFVTFWIHEWSNESSWLVHVVSEESVNKLYPLKITPQPSEIKRFYLLFGKDISHIPLQPLRIAKWEMSDSRTVIQWGAALYNFNAHSS